MRRIFRHWLAGGEALSCRVCLCCTKGWGRKAAAGIPGGCGAAHGGHGDDDGRLSRGDGLADVADGLGGNYDRERALDIMKDSRIGALVPWHSAGAAGQGQRCWRCWARTARGGAGGTGGGMCSRGCGRCSSCGGCRMWVTRPDQKANHWPTRFHAARWRQQFCGVFASGACLSSANVVFNSIYHRQYGGCRLDGALVCAPSARFTGDCLGATQQVGEIGFTWAPPWPRAQRGEPAAWWLVRHAAPQAGTCYGALDVPAAPGPPSKQHSDWPRPRQRVR